MKKEVAYDYITKEADGEVARAVEMYRNHRIETVCRNGGILSVETGEGDKDGE